MPRTIIQVLENNSGIPTMVLHLPRGYPDARKGFELLFPSIPFQAQDGSEALDAPDHGLEQNQKVRVKLSTDGLGLGPQIDYYVECIDQNKIKLSRDAGPGSAVMMRGSGMGELLTWPQAPVFRKLEAGVVRPKLVEEAGKLIFQALRSHPAVEQALTQALIVGRTAAGTLGSCLPIGLLLDPVEADNIPWEMLHVPPTMLAGSAIQFLPFLALNSIWPVVRLKDLPSVPEYVFTPPVKILAILSATGPNQEQLGNDREWEALRSAVVDSGLQEFELRALVSDPALLKTIKAEGKKDSRISAGAIVNRDTLKKEIKKFGPQLLHFFCHGTAGPSSSLVIGDSRDWDLEQAGSIYLEARDLTELQDPSQRIWVVALICCEGAHSGNKSQNLANALTEQGFHTVIGMRAKVNSPHAHVFSEKFYTTLLQLIDQKLQADDSSEIEWAMALGAARSGILDHCTTGTTPDQVAPECIEWTLPVLYTRRDPVRVRRITPKQPEESKWGPWVPNIIRREPEDPLMLLAQLDELKRMRALLDTQSELNESRRKELQQQLDDRIEEVQKKLSR